MGKLLPVVIAVIGLVLGAGAGYMLKPSAAPETGDGHETAAAHGEEGAHSAPASDAGHGAKEGESSDYVKLNNQFVVPVVHNGKVAALVVLSLSLEMSSGGSELVYAREPKLRDALLQVMFDHANAGGFDGAFTESGNMTLLRRALLEVCEEVLGQKVRDVLVTDIVRQDA